jgi:ABC-2 type transport system permease protein
LLRSLRVVLQEFRAESVLATAVPRIGWLAATWSWPPWAQRSCSPPGGLLAGLAHDLRAGDLGGELPAVLGSALVQLPAVWVMAGIAAALFGLLPRLVVGAWVVLAVVVFITTFGEPLQLAQWVLDLSPFTHLLRLPAAEFMMTPLAWLLAITAVVAAAGLAGFRRRDLVGTA